MYSHTVWMFFLCIPQFWNLTSVHGLKDDVQIMDIARWRPNYVSYPRQVSMLCFHLSVGHSNLNILPLPQKQHVWNTLFSIFISNLSFFYFCSSYHQFPCIWVFPLTFTLKLAFINLVLCFFPNLSHLYTSFPFLAQIFLPTKLFFSLFLIRLKLWPLHFFSHSSPFRNTGPLPLQSKFYSFFKIK